MTIPSSYAVFDTETTGFSPQSDQLIEIGWLRVINGVPEPPASLLIQSSVPVPPAVEVLTGISTAMLEARGVPLYEALLTFFDDTQGLPLVGHNNVRFDVPFLEAACLRCQILPPERHRYIDTAAIYKASRMPRWPRALAAQDWAWYAAVLGVPTRGLKFNLLHCCTELGVKTEDVRAHRAGSDVVLTARLYAALMKRAAAA